MNKQENKHAIKFGAKRNEGHYRVWFICQLLQHQTNGLDTQTFVQCMRNGFWLWHYLKTLYQIVRLFDV